MTEFRGSCLCGSVTYLVKGTPLAFYHCHCSRCRKAYGGGHASNIRVDSREIEWLSGEEQIKSYKIPEAERFRNDFCSQCGSPVPRYFKQHGFLIIPAGSLDHPIDIQPSARIFYGSRAEWSCSDGLPTFEGMPQ